VSKGTDAQAVEQPSAKPQATVCAAAGSAANGTLVSFLLYRRQSLDCHKKKNSEKALPENLSENPNEKTRRDSQTIEKSNELLARYEILTDATKP
jgi:hypothetical protein